MKVIVQNLTKRYGSHQIFSGLNAEMEPNKITCLYGKSGCGKTTLINIIGLIESYQKGTITYDGKEIKKRSEKRRMLQEKIGFIFQDFGLIEDETVKNNFLIVNKIRKMRNSEARIAEALNHFQMDAAMMRRKVYELSGGEQQRIAIAKIWLKNPDLILADEPTASLDVENKIIVLQMLRDFSDSGKTVIIVSHDQEIIRFADLGVDLNPLKSGE